MSGRRTVPASHIVGKVALVVAATAFECIECGYRTAKWMGFCPQCRRDGGLHEVAGHVGAKVAPAVPTRLSTAAGAVEHHRSVGIAEIDRVLGGGIVPGSAVLVGGEPGVGKSTLLLQLASAVAATGATALVVSAEESARQVAMRAARLELSGDGVSLLAESDVDVVIASAIEVRPDVLIVDSIQTVGTRDVDGSPGGVGQVRESGARLVTLAKERSIAVIIVGHVTKDGSIAGPKILEHMVDVVLYLEGDSSSGLRVLRCLKNRFGPVQQIGLFEMGGDGMTEMVDPSATFVAQRAGDVPGSLLFPAVDGRRPLLVEVQALVSRATTPQPRRSVKGIEAARVHQLLAVLERHAGLSFSDRDVYVNVVGGVRLREPAADLPVALALASSLLDRPALVGAAWGEVGLTGEVRKVPQGDRRTHEVNRLGITRFVSPDDGGPGRIDGALALAGLRP